MQLCMTEGILKLARRRENARAKGPHLAFIANEAKFQREPPEVRDDQPLFFIGGKIFAGDAIHDVEIAWQRHPGEMPEILVEEVRQRGKEDVFRGTDVVRYREVFCPQ